MKIVKPKIYATEKVEAAIKALAETPALPPKFIAHEDAISELSSHIKELHFKKNYEAKEIVQLMKINGIKTTLKEVKNILSIQAKKRA